MVLTTKWEHDYIEGLDLTQIEWIKLNSKQLEDFYRDNYLDKEAWEWVHDESAKGCFISPIGLRYLDYSAPIDDINKKYSYLLGIVNNKANKKTIVAAMVYLDSYFIFENQETPVTYISTIETNSYFWNKGLFHQLCGAIIRFVNPEQHILITKLSDMGLKINLFEKLRENLIKKGFTKNILIDNWEHKEYRQFLKTLGTMPK